MTRHELRTPRPSLRAWREGDREPFTAMNADPEVMRWFPSTTSGEHCDLGVDRFSVHHDEHGYPAWALEVRDSARGAAPFIGFLGPVRPSFDPPFSHTVPGVEIGFRRARPWWGAGLTTEAGRALVQFAFLEAGLAEVVSVTVSPDIRTQAVMHRFGLRYDGVVGDLAPSTGPSGRTHP